MEGLSLRLRAVLPAPFEDVRVVLEIERFPELDSRVISGEHDDSDA